MSSSLLDALRPRRRLALVFSNQSWRLKCAASQRVNGLKAWAVSEAEVARYAAVPTLAAQLKGVLQSACPPLRLDQAALQAQFEALSEQAQRATLVNQIDRQVTAQATAL